MRCRVCGYDGAFDEETVISEVDVSYGGGQDDDRDGFPRQVVEDLRQCRRILHICPNCRIVYAFIE